MILSMHDIFFTYLPYFWSIRRIFAMPSMVSSLEDQVSVD